MKHFDFSKESFDLVVGGLQVIFLLLAISLSLIFLVRNYLLTFRGFALVWCLCYLFFITTSLRQQVRDNPRFKKRTILNWAFAAFVGIALSVLFISFIV
ncbi:MAG: hypothetical protein ACTSYO_10195 [Candidatus Ranarchaeia archaeon]